MNFIKTILAILLFVLYGFILSLLFTLSSVSYAPPSLVGWIIAGATITILTAGMISTSVYAFKGSSTNIILKVFIIVPLIIFILYYYLISTGINWDTYFLQIQGTSSNSASNELLVPVR